MSQVLDYDDLPLGVVYNIVELNIEDPNSLYRFLLNKLKQKATPVVFMGSADDAEDYGVHRDLAVDDITDDVVDVIKCSDSKERLALVDTLHTNIRKIEGITVLVSDWMNLFYCCGPVNGDYLFLCIDNPVVGRRFIGSLHPILKEYYWNIIQLTGPNVCIMKSPCGFATIQQVNGQWMPPKPFNLNEFDIEVEVPVDFFC